MDMDMQMQSGSHQSPHVHHTSTTAGNGNTTLTNDDIEAVIQMATSSRGSPDGHTGGVGGGRSTLPIKDTRTQLFVGNLPYRVRWQDLKDLFRRSGTVLRADVSLGPDNRSRGYGTVLLATAEDAGRAIDLFNGYSWQTRVLEVRPDRLPPDYDASYPPPCIGGGWEEGEGVGGGGGGSGGVGVGVGNGVQGAGGGVDYSKLLDLHYGYTANLPLRSLFVGNLPFHCQWQDLKDLFRQAGAVMRADVALGQDGRSRGFGTVTFATEGDADRALHMFNGYEYNGRTLKVNHDKFTQLVSQQQQQQQQPLTGNANANVSVGLGAGLGIGIGSGGSSLGGTPSSSVSPASISPAPSLRSAAVSSLPSAYQARQLSSLNSIAIANPAAAKLPIGYHHLAATASTSSSSSPAPAPVLDVWQQMEKARDELERERERERELQRTFAGLDINRTLSTSSVSAPNVSRTTSHGAPGMATAVSAGSRLQAQVVASLLPPSIKRHRRMSSADHIEDSSGSGSEGSSPAAVAPPSQSRLQTHRSPPRHPGPISLPPPPFVPHAHAHSVPSMSPGPHPLHSPGIYAPPHPVMHMHHHQLITPLGLITPSMPPFNFLPPGSPSTSAPNPNPPAPAPPSPYTHPLPPSPMMHPHLMMMHSGGSSPLHHPHLHHTHTHTHHHPSPFGITPLSPPNSATAPTFPSSTSSNISGPPPPPPHPQQQQPQQQQPQTPFSPGVTMSPGTFWGRPGGPNPHTLINPAVGAPVHPHPHPVIQPHAHAYGSQQQLQQEPTGYFDGVWYPSQSQSQSQSQGGGDGDGREGGVGGGPSVDEIIMKNGSGKDEDRDREQQQQREVHVAEGEEEEAKTNTPARDEVSEAEAEVDNNPPPQQQPQQQPLPPLPKARRHSLSSATSTPWQHPFQAQAQAQVQGAGALELEFDYFLHAAGKGGE